MATLKNGFTLSAISLLLVSVGAALFFHAEWISVNNNRIISKWILILPMIVYFGWKLAELPFKNRFQVSNVYFNFILLLILPPLFLYFFNVKVAIVGFLVPLILVLIFVRSKKLKKWKSLVTVQIITSMIIFFAGAFAYQSTAVTIQNGCTSVLIDSEDPLVAKAELKPDIYYVLLDAQTSFESLYKYFGLNDSLIINEYNAQDFQIINNASCIYDQTPVSMTSTLNMSLLQEKPTLSNPDYFKKLIPCIRNAKVFRTIDKLGYRIYNYSIFDILHHSSFYGYGLQAEYSSYFKVMIRNTSIGLLALALKKSDLHYKNKMYESLPKDHEAVLKNLNEHFNADNAIPEFVYAHLMLPHHPYYMNSNGRFISDLDSIFPTEIELKKYMYLEQSEYVHRKLQKIFSTRNNERPYIIIIQGDHGFREMGTEIGEEEGFSITYLIKTSGLPEMKMDEDKLSVNTFKVVFNNYFGTDLEYTRR